ncbi:hypothetical protein TSUD_398890 [Trifolium subterraneum]|uniref:AAA+ ATPase domain-containing protein n=1 Tax=Trifolium subterraneum TaxID=3900 RepID=A0A2Z6P4K8_TRISU|nr:hypothetical protein TSUD_398890 [Trifolium subterraneum]
MEILASFVGPVVDYIVVPIGRQVSYLIFYKSNFKKLADHVENLEAARKTIIDLVEEERRNGKIIEINVANWLEKVNEVTRKADILQNDPRRANVRCSRCWFPNLILRHQLSRQSTKIAKDMLQVQGKGKFDRVAYRPILDGAFSSSITRGGECYETRESLKEDILKALVDLKSSNIGVYGLGGVGKTTLVKEVALIAMEQKLFDIAVITHVSENPDIKTIQGEIADFLGLQFDEETSFGRATRLRQRIKMEKSILVILDNMWTMLDLKKVGIPFGNEHNGCKLLMTCRNQDVLLKMNVPNDFTFKLELLSENETWNLFQFMAGDVVKDINLKDVAFQVAQKCEGLPLRVVTVARAMKNRRDVKYWEYALRKLQSNDGLEMDAKTNSALELSYDSLESDEMRDLFLLFSFLLGIEVFPSNIISSLTKLEELYMGDTSINWEKGNSTDNNGNASIVELHKLPNLTALELQIRESWMLPTDLQLMFEKLNYFKIVIGDVWEWADIKDGTLKTLMLKLGTSIDLQHGIKALIKGVENLYLDDVDGIQNVLYQLNGEGFPLLKHLHVQHNANMKHIVDSKDRIQIHVSFPALETLVLHNLRNLEHICHGPLSITSFGSLSVIKVKNCIQLKYLLSYTMVKGLPQLSEIEVCHCNNMKEIVLKDNNSSANNDIANEKIDFLLLRSLTLEHLETIDDFFSSTNSRSKQKYHGLEPYVSAPFFNAQVVFPRLDTLKLSSLLNLNKIWDDNYDSMHNLTSLIVDNCGGLKYLFSSTGVGSFKNLKHLEISNCAMMEEIIAKENGNGASEEVAFPKLDALKLSSLLNLNKIWDGNYDSMHNLTSLIVDNCGGLKYLFSSTEVGSFKNLKHLEISNCAMMEEIITTEEGNGASEEVQFCKLEKIILKDMDSLKTIWRRQFETLKKLHVNNCNKIVVVFPSSMQKTYNKLEMLEVTNCGLVEEIFEIELTSTESSSVGDTTYLKEVTIVGLDKLKNIWSRDPEGILSFQNLINVKATSCVSLEYLLPLSVATRCTNLKELHIKQCLYMKEIVAEEKESSVKAAPRTLSDKNSVSTQQPPFIIDTVIPNLEQLRITSKDANTILQAQNLSSLFPEMTFLGLSAYTNEVAFPYWFFENARRLEKLVIESSCFEKIFQDEGQIREKTQTQIKKLILSVLPNLEHICEEGFRIDSVLELLEHLEVAFGKFKYLALSDYPEMKDLEHLEMLVIDSCRVEQIVAMEEGSLKINFNFPQLKIMKLFCLTNLKSFYQGKHILECPSLEILNVCGCKALKMFSFSQMDTDALFSIDKLSPNLEQLTINGTDMSGILKRGENIFDKVEFLCFQCFEETPTVFLDEYFYTIFPNLKIFQMSSSSFEMLFPTTGHLDILISKKIKNLLLCELENLKHICQEDFPLEDLKELVVRNCPSLISLVPSSTSFTNLIHLWVGNCKELNYLITPSTAKSLIQLRTLKIKNCEKMLDVVKIDEKAEEVIIFENLEILGFTNLPSLGSFCCGNQPFIFPSLQSLTAQECPRMEIFSSGVIVAPYVTQIEVGEGTIQWKGDINTTIQHLFLEKVHNIKADNINLVHDWKLTLKLTVE